MSEVLVITNTEQLVTTARELVEIASVEQLVITERVVEREVLEVPVNEQIAVEPPQALVQTQVVRELIEVARQGPPGPAGPVGPAGGSGVGGVPVELTDPQPGEVMALTSGPKWVNEDILDGGNF